MKKIALSVIATVFMFACQSKPTETTEETPIEEMVLIEDTLPKDITTNVSPAETFYTVRGQIVKIGETDAEGNALVMVNHEKVADVMMAMQMNFKTNAAFLNEIAKDDKVSFEILKTDEGYTMRNVSKLPAETELTLKK